MSSTEIFRVEGLPVLQNRTFATAEEALSSPVGDVILVQNSETGLIYNDAFEPGKLVYDQSYQNEQAVSSVFQTHLEQVAHMVRTNVDRGKAIEIGCGKGYFLELLRSQGVAITGFDPAYEGESPDVIKAAFDKSLGLTADFVVLRHVLEHIPDPVEFLSDIAAANGGRGNIYIEVPCFDWISSHNAWFDIFYEHVNYFRLNDFHRMFGRIHDSGHLFGGQYMFVIADLATLRLPRATRKDATQLPADFIQGIESARAKIENSGSRRCALWGGASKGVIFSVHLQRAGQGVDVVIDINPAKQNRFLGVSGLPVSSPEQAYAMLDDGDTVFVMNSNYLNEIKLTSGNRYSYYTIEK